jgi:N-acetylneuraminic acid mutarotase
MNHSTCKLFTPERLGQSLRRQAASRLSLALCLSASLLFAAEHKPEPLPVALSNNAVAAVKVSKHLFVFSFMGMGAKKTWKDVTNRAFSLDPDTGKWTELRPVPGPSGRLAASAAGAHDFVYLLGGHTVAGNGEETSVRSVEMYVPQRGVWYRGADMPMPLDDSVVGVYRDRYIYTVSGWSQDDAVRNVMIYDTEKDSWQQGTAIPGTPVFGHAGALLDDTIVYVDGAYKNPAGAKPKYVASEECWMGKIDHKDPTKITWTKLPNHPGKARYRIAAGPSEHDHKIYFSGGSDNPHNYDGIGYDGRPSEPVATTFAYDIRAGKWETVSDKTPNPTMDHRGLVVTSRELLRIGGMEAGQKVTARVSEFSHSGK